MPVADPNPWQTILDVAIPSITAIVGVIGSLYVYKEKVSNIEKNIDRLTTDMREIRDKVIACETSLKERIYFQSQSPVSLTPGGEELLKSSGGKLFVDNNFEELEKIVDSYEPKTAYDVQELSLTVLEELRHDDRYNPIKDYAFQEGLPLRVIIKAMALHLRDMILTHKGWNIADIDHQAPNS